MKLLDQIEESVGSLEQSVRFDIHETPMTREEIDDVRGQAMVAREEIEMRQWRYFQGTLKVVLGGGVFALFVAIGALISESVGSLSVESLNSPFAIFLFAVAVPSFGGYIGLRATRRNELWRKEHRLKALLSELENIKRQTDPCREVIEMAKSDPVVNRFQNRIAEQGRMPVMGEYRAMKEYTQGQPCREAASPVELEASSDR